MHKIIDWHSKKEIQLANNQIKKSAASWKVEEIGMLEFNLHEGVMFV